MPQFWVCPTRLLVEREAQSMVAVAISTVNEIAKQ